MSKNGEYLQINYSCPLKMIYFGFVIQIFMSLGNNALMYSQAFMIPCTVVGFWIRNSRCKVLYVIIIKWSHYNIKLAHCSTQVSLFFTTAEQWCIFPVLAWV